MSVFSKYTEKMNKEKCEQILIYLVSAVICIWTIIPTLKIATYSYPVQDDFAYMTNVRDYMSQGNGVIKSCAIMTAQYYRHFVGAYASSFLGHFFEHIIQGTQRNIACFEIISLLIFDVAVLAFVYAFVKKIFGFRNVVVAGTYALMLSFINNVIYYPESEDYYWLITSIQYLLLFSFSLLGVFMAVMSVGAKKKWQSVTYITVGSVFLFLGSGANLCLAFINVELIFIAGVCLFATKQGKKTLFIPFAVACIGTFINGLAPGNYERKGKPVTMGMLTQSVMDSFRYAIERVGKMFSKPLFVVFIVILVILLIRYADDIAGFIGGYKLAVIPGILLLCAVSAAIFPGIMGYGYGVYGILMRGNFLSDVMIYISVLLEAIYVVGWVKYRFFVSKSMPLKWYVALVAMAIIVFCGVRLRNSEWRWTPIVRMYREINSGRMQSYSDYVWTVYNHLAQDEEEDIVLYIHEPEDKTCMISPYFVYGDHDENFKDYDASIVKYYNKHALYLYNVEE